jgi:Cu/Ag efflux pump CusA
MIRRFSAFALRARFVIVAASLALAVVGIYSFWTLDIEAYPDPVQPRVEIVTQPIGLSAEEVERLTTVQTTLPPTSTVSAPVTCWTLWTGKLTMPPPLKGTEIIFRWT